MPSSHATTTNISQTISDHGSVSCEVVHITDASANALSDNKFIHVECDMGGNFYFDHGSTTHQDRIKLQDTNADKLCTIDMSANNLRNSNGGSLTPPTSLHMEILRDMYESSARPTTSAITASFTDTSITVFRNTLYGAIKHALDMYIASRFKDGSNNAFTPTIRVKTDGSSIEYGNDDTHNGFQYTGGDDPDGTEHGHMFLINLLKTCNQSGLKEEISRTSDATIPIATLLGSGHMVVGLKVTTTGGFKNDHTNYAVGIRFE